MTPADSDTQALALWQLALHGQRQLEAELAAMKRQRRRAKVRELQPQVEALRTRADLLLAEAVKLQCILRDAASRAPCAHRKPIAAAGE